MDQQDDQDRASWPRCVVFFELLPDGRIETFTLGQSMDPADLIRGLREEADRVWTEEEAKV